MEVWKRNLYILWIGNFLTSVGIGMIIPFLPLYVQDLGVHDVKQAALWAAMIFGINHLMIALISPLWGKFSDTYGQKLVMVITAIGSAVIIAAMGLVDTPIQLLLLRAAFGTMGGYPTSSVALLAIEAPKQKVGNALGTLQTGQVTGQLLGPLIGGVLAEWLGIRDSFFITGLFIFIAALLTVVGVKETTKYSKFRFTNLLKLSHPILQSKNRDRKVPSKTALRQVLGQSPLILTLFISTYLISISFASISPMISLYVKSMNIVDHIEIMAGLIFASTALGTMITAPILGRMGDRHGHSIILLLSLILIAILHIPQGLVTDPWVLMGIRFVTGLCIGGVIPSISSLLRKLTPSHIQGSVFAYNASAGSLGNLSGAIFGGLVASSLGISLVFYIIAGVFFVHFLMILIQFKRFRKAEKEQEAA
ncbi:Predicted arabinose efflux permease, MFS family [Paenibacillus sp. 1_12]|uniref:MFS transporter n=1 Tax=Paenibacillus sp. 1_12 TaxID=1566278 RepID=UPI0008EE307B|nr:MFS transporter [Paenibacillus sp. 1_12]SFL60401.1 Predicted arabinose efflux permease, MFS family [Paenibacillus sp. 1_12]